MKVLGLIVEYNPMHQGHLYHIKKAKEMTNSDVVICVMSGNFVQRGEPAIINKFNRATMAINNGIDLVIELPLVYAVESSDYFCKEAVSILNDLHVDTIVFGSESGDIEEFKTIAKTIYDNEENYNKLVKDNMQDGLRYPDACNKALSSLLNKSVTSPNDILGLGYVKEVIKNNYPIDIRCLKRTSDYFSNDENNDSAFSIRNSLKTNHKLIDQLIDSKLYDHLYFQDDFYVYLRYKIITSSLKELRSIHLVDEGMENLLKKNILTTNSYEKYVNSLTSKRYTRSRIQRMLIHILLNNTKEDINEAMKINYVRVLKMNDVGQKYLKDNKDKIKREVITNFSTIKHPALDIEYKGACLLSLVSNTSIIEKEYKNIPVIK